MTRCASPWLDDGFLSWPTGHRPDVTLALARAVTDTGTAAIPYFLAVAAGVPAGPGLLILAVSLRAPRSATVFRVVIACWGMLVGLTRLYLGVHWFTDVVGGWLFGIGWLATFLWLSTRWLPASLTSPTTQTAEHRTENHAPQDPGRRGRSRPA